ncbi:MAG: alpha/beta hydrolase [Erysipelotrichia bacterium]|jgi:pimeloyl-ACP methyl ester carboxylesterase|nr:alpha/beta hydrolase [Erysipelotrichia bacterium]
MIKFIFKLIKRILLLILLLFLGLPYFIPRDGREGVPSQPFENSLFVNTSQGIPIHTRIDQPTQPMKGQIMLVHGLGGSTFSYEDNAPFLASQGYFVVSVDLPAFGFSSRQTGLVHSQENRAMWLWDVLNQIEVLYNLPSTWILGGHSMGGSVVLAMNNEQPNKTLGLILIDPAVSGRNTRGRLLQGVVKYTPVGEWLRVFLTYGLLNEEQFKSSLSSAYGVEATKEQVNAYLRPLRIKGTTQALREFFATSSSVGVDEWLTPHTKTIVIWGEDDAWIPVTQLEAIEEVAKNLQTFVLPNEGHNPMETNPALFNQSLIEGLNKWRNQE